MTSSIPAVLDALAALGRAALPAEVRVWDGEPLTSDREMLCVGFTGDVDAPAVESTRTSEQATRVPEHESYIVTSLLYALAGDQDARRPRERVFELFALLVAELRRDPELGGAAARTQLTSSSLTQAQTEKGAEAQLRFSLAVDAWVR